MGAEVKNEEGMIPDEVAVRRRIAHLEAELRYLRRQLRLSQKFRDEVDNLGKEKKDPDLEGPAA